MNPIGKTSLLGLLFILGNESACGARSDAAADAKKPQTIDESAPAESTHSVTFSPSTASDAATHSVTSAPPVPTDASTQSVTSPSAAARTRTEPRELAVPGFGAALVVVPVGNEPRPLLVAAHGAGDSPRWQCRHWDAVARGRFVVLCPRGVALSSGDDPGYFYRDHLELEREVTAALAALRGELGARLSAERGVYSGYSQGATMGALMVVDHGADFPNLVLVEGGSGEWTLGRAQRFRKTGGQSVAIVCGTPGCAKRGARSVALLEKAGLRARVEHVEHGGHVYDGPVGARAAALLDEWVFER